MNLDDVLSHKAELDKMLKEKIKSFGTYVEASQKIGVDVGDISRYMSGKRQWSFDKIIKILRRFENAEKN